MPRRPDSPGHAVTDGMPDLYHVGSTTGAWHSPRPDEIVFALVMGTGGRVHSRLGGLLKENVVGNDGQR